MRHEKTLIFLFSIFVLTSVYGQKDNKRVIFTIDSTQSPELVLVQEITLKASLDKVWSAYTTKEGWESWAVPLAEVNFKVGGTIKTNYNKEGVIGDSTTITTHIVNYVPKKLITLQAEITNNFPEFMKKEAEDFYNVIYFNELKRWVYQSRVLRNWI